LRRLSFDFAQLPWICGWVASGFDYALLRSALCGGIICWEFVWGNNEMAQEIERKFLTKSDAWRSLAQGLYYRQGYIDQDDRTSVRLAGAAIVVTQEDIELAFPVPEADAIAMARDFQPDAAGRLDPATCTPRIRVAGEIGYLTLKTKTIGISRSEYEYTIPKIQALALLDLVCNQPQIEKYRFKIPIGDVVWEVDEFLGGNAGLVVAEVELATEGQSIALPDWVGEEVSDDVRYFNSYLAKCPYSTW
jgi:adenylate cyclase